MKKAITVIVLLLSLSVIPAWAQTTLRVGLFRGTPPDYKLPFVSFGHFKQYNGIAVDVWKKVARINHYHYQFIPIEKNYQQAIQDLRAGKYDVLVGAFSVTPAREKIVDFSKSFFINDQEVAVQRRDAKVAKLLDVVYQNPRSVLKTAFKNYSMAVASNTSSVATANELSNDVKTYPSLYAALRALAHGKVDTAIGDGVLESAIIKKNPHWDIKLINIVIKQEPYAFVLAKNSPLKKPIDNAMNQITAAEISEICNPYQTFVEKKWNW